MKFSKSLLATSSIYIFSTFFSQAVNFFALMIFARMMSPANCGIYSMYLLWTSILMIFVGLQSNGSINNAYIDYRGKKIFSYVSSMAFLNIVSLAAVIPVCWLFKAELSRIFELPEPILFIGILQAALMYYFYALINVFRVQERPFMYLFFTVSSILLDVVLSIFLIWKMTENKYAGKVYGSLIMAVVIGCTAAAVIYAKGRLFYRSKYVKYAFLYSVPLIFHGVASTIFGRADSWFLMKFAGADAAGIYSIGMTFGGVFSVLCTACNLAFVPWYYKNFAAGDVTRIVSLSRLYMFLFTMVFSAMLLVIPEAVVLIAPPEYHKAVWFAPQIAWAFFFLFLYTFPSTYLFYHKKTVVIALFTIAGMLVNIAVNFFMVPRFGIIGAAFAPLGAYFTLWVLNLIAANLLHRNYELSFRFFLLPIVISAVFIGVYYLLLDHMIIRWTITVLIGAATLYACWKRRGELLAR